MAIILAQSTLGDFADAVLARRGGAEEAAAETAQTAALTPAIRASSAAVHPT